METLGKTPPHFKNVEKKTIDGHEVTIRTADQAAVNHLKERIAATEFTEDMVRGHLEVFTQFLEWPMITDDFGDNHNARTDWRNGLMEKGLTEDYAFLESGVLRGNNLGGVLSRFEMLKVMAEQLQRFAVVNGQNPEDFQTVVNAGITLQQEMNTKYESMTPKERERFAERTAELVELAAWGLVKLFEKAEGERNAA